MEKGSFKPVVLIRNLFTGTTEHSAAPEPDVVRRLRAIRDEVPASDDHAADNDKWIPIWTDRVPTEQPAGPLLKNVAAVAIPDTDSPGI